MTKLKVLPGVASDLAGAADWYKERGGMALSTRFENNFYGSVQLLLTTGERHRRVYDDFRRIYLKPFPYAVYYRYHGDLLVVVLLIHIRRDPELIKRLLSARS